MTALEQHKADARERLRNAKVTRAGPGSVSWKINRERLVIVGWGRAILLQFAHPLVAAAINDHSSFRGSLKTSFGRLWSTVAAMLSLTFGDDEEAVTTAARINVIHDHVFGRLRASAGTFSAGEKYSAHDAELLRWVHTTLLDSIPLTYELLIGPLTQEERDRYCVEAAIMEPLLDIPAGMLPRNRTELDARVRDMFDSGDMAITAGSRALARAVLFPPRWRLFWPLFRPVQLITIGLLPAAVRDAYGFEWTRRDARALARWTMAVRLLRRFMPAFVSAWAAARKDSSASSIGPAVQTKNPPVEVLCDSK
jgi:uncharacterized protein (DUF2236 family)